jgi:hypothetical protein
VLVQVGLALAALIIKEAGWIEGRESREFSEEETKKIGSNEEIRTIAKKIVRTDLRPVKNSLLSKITIEPEIGFESDSSGMYISKAVGPLYL